MEVLFNISREDITASFDIVDFSETECYHTIKYINNKKIGEGETSSNDILNGKVDWIDNDEHKDWIKAVYNFIDTHNDKVKNNTTGNVVDFVITDIDERGACTYQKKVNGKFTSEGKGWYKDLNSKIEKEAWKNAVIKFKKENGIMLVSQKINELIDQINEAVDSLDSEIPDDFILTPPMIDTALSKINDEPCNFISNIKQSATCAVMYINGSPSPKEIINYYAKLVKDNLQSAKKIATDSQRDTVKCYVTPVTEKIQESAEYFAQLDALDTEIRKNNSDDICIFETVLEKPYIYTPYTYTYETIEETSNDETLIDDIKYIDTPSSTNFTLRSYKEVEPNIIAKGGTCRSGRPNRNVPKYIYDNIYNALQNCWIPLRIAWENYCKNKGTNPYWIISSGYRPDSASYGSAHGSGWAIDVQPYFKSNKEKVERSKELAAFIFQYCKSHREIKVDQILREYNGANSSWCHIGYKRPSTREQRGQYFANFNANGSSGSYQII